MNLKNRVGAFCLCFIVILFLATPNSIHAQSEKQYFYWVNFGLGKGSIGEGGEMAIILDGTFQFGKNVLSLRYSLVGELLADDFYDYGLLYGRAFHSSTFFASGGVGLGLVEVRRGGLFTGKETIYKFGFPLETQLFWRPLRFLGIGLYGFANFNSEESFYGFAICLQAGKLR